MLGVGVGTLREEFDALGATFEGRGVRADDAIRAIRATLGTPEAGVPRAALRLRRPRRRTARRPHRLPIWVGGRTRRSLRRAIELGDGWTPFALSIEQAGEMLAWGRERAGVGTAVTARSM